MNNQVITPGNEVPTQALTNALRKACKKIAPVWPLENFVAVNPYLGLTDLPFETAAQRLATVGGVQMTLPVSFYKSKIREGKITLPDLQAALAKHRGPGADAAAFLRKLDETEDTGQPAGAIATLTDVAAQVSGTDWNRFVIARISAWAASYFDNGQASWVAADQQESIFAAWKTEAEADRTPELTGLTNFRKAVNALPGQPEAAVQQALALLDLPEQALDPYLHRLLMRVGGWAAYVARLDWDSELYGGKDGRLIEFLSVLICWEACLLRCLDTPELRAAWLAARQQLSAAGTRTAVNQQLAEKLVLQDAFDKATQRELIAKFQTPEAPAATVPVTAQAIFCIDVRSEVFRRNLELVDRSIETMGFAGFFAFPVTLVPVAHDKGEAQCPVLIKAGPTILEEIPGNEANRQAYQSRVQRHQVQQIWKSFKAGAVTCFSFVSPLGISYLPKLFTDSFGLTRPVPHPDNAGMSTAAAKARSISLEVDTHGQHTVGIPLEQRVVMARNALTAMSLTTDFAGFVLLVGHGSTTVNNPHATGLDCGACGGHTGEANAKVAAAVLNDAAVRQQLPKEGILIPDSTVFLACLHDTTTDEVTIYNEHEVPAERAAALRALKQSLAKAGQAARAERAVRMHTSGNVDAAIKTRSKDWSQVRPEWGLAGCSAFVVAPRERTRHLNLGGQSFLHSYDWEKDTTFSVLELIMTAPMVVTSWINLQYYASTVDNKQYGSGNKTLHNVTAGVGVLEGYSGDLRTGLPLQSVHDGEKYQHEPAKLNVIIEAPREAMNAILERHQQVRNLCDNGWIHLLAMDENGTVSHRYAGILKWERLG